jgi:hypothetical protein
MPPIFRLVLVIVTTIAVAGRYLQEAHRLSVIKRLPGPRARDYYERTRENSERFLTWLTAGLVVGAVAAIIYTFAVGQ